MIYDLYLPCNKMINKKINSRAKRDTHSNRYNVIKKYILYRKDDAMHIIETFLLIYSERFTLVKCARVPLSPPSSPHMRMHVCAYYTYVSTTPAHHEHRGTEREYVHWTLTRKRRRRGRFVLGLRQQVDEIRAYGTPSTEMNKWRKRSIAFHRETPCCHPRATCFAILMFPHRFSQRIYPKLWAYAKKNHRWNQKFFL